MKHENLTIIGTSHIAAQSINEVRAAFKENPEIIALELDFKRLNALLTQQKNKLSLVDIKRFGLKGFLFALLGNFAQQKLGKFVGIEPGSEMKEAFFLAKEKKLPVALIDQDIELTMRKLSKALTWKEKFSFLADIFNGLFFGKKQIKKLGIDFDLKTVPSKNLIKKILEKVKTRYPNIYGVLVAERNALMAFRLSQLMKQNPEKRILAIMGAGHEEEIIEMIKKAKKTKL